MINEQYKNMLGGKSVIREFSEFAAARGKEIGYENVFDYSLGNPSVPVPDDYTKEMEGDINGQATLLDISCSSPIKKALPCGGTEIFEPDIY